MINHFQAIYEQNRIPAIIIFIIIIMSLRAIFPSIEIFTTITIWVGVVYLGIEGFYQLGELGKSRRKMSQRFK